MHKSLILFVSFILLSSFSTATPEPGGPQDLKEGDLIFHISQSQQSSAIEEAQGSPYTHMGILFYENSRWFVYEAVQPVKATPLNQWIGRGKYGHYVTRRINSELVNLDSPANLRALKIEFRKYWGKDYDLFFQWSDESIYCSELIFKAFRNVFAVEIGDLQIIRDLNLSGPNIQRLIRERERMLGEPVNYEEPIITPVALLTGGVRAISRQQRD